MWQQRELREQNGLQRLVHLQVEGLGSPHRSRDKRQQALLSNAQRDVVRGTLQRLQQRVEIQLKRRVAHSLYRALAVLDQMFQDRI